jgi:hypothetical protein
LRTAALAAAQGQGGRGGASARTGDVEAPVAIATRHRRSKHRSAMVGIAVGVVTQESLCRAGVAEPRPRHGAPGLHVGAQAAVQGAPYTAVLIVQAGGKAATDGICIEARCVVGGALRALLEAAACCWAAELGVLATVRGGGMEHPAERCGDTLHSEPPRGAMCDCGTVGVAIAAVLAKVPVRIGRGTGRTGCGQGWGARRRGGTPSGSGGTGSAPAPEQGRHNSRQEPTGGQCWPPRGMASRHGTPPRRLAVRSVQSQLRAAAARLARPYCKPILAPSQYGCQK